MDDIEFAGGLYNLAVSDRLKYAKDVALILEAAELVERQSAELEALRAELAALRPGEEIVHRAIAAPPAPQQQGEPVAVEMSPDFTDTSRAALLWVLWHHQGASSPIGQPLRFALGMGATEPLAEYQVAEAKRWAALTKSTTADFHAAPLAPQPAWWRGDGMPTSSDERYLRRLLAYRVAIPGAYYDDGEAHGAEHGIAIDFMREPVAHIDAKLRALNVARAECAQPAGRALTDAEIDAITDAQWGRGAVPSQYAAHRAYARAVIAADRKVRGIGRGSEHVATD